MEKSTWPCCTLSCFLMLWAPRVTLIEPHREQNRGMRSVESQEIQPRSCDGPVTAGQGRSWGEIEVTDSPGGVTLCLVLFNDMSAGLLGAFSGILWNSCEFAWGTYRGEFSKILMSEGITHPRISENVLWLHKWPPISFWLRLLGIVLLGFQVTGVGGGHCHRQWSN